jgi:hypothetical protein
MAAMPAVGVSRVEEVELPPSEVSYRRFDRLSSAGLLGADEGSTRRDGHKYPHSHSGRVVVFFLVAKSRQY